METHLYPLVIKEVHLDVYAHVNNARYLEFFEEARWAFINRTGYGYQKIMTTGLGPVILEVTIKYLKELRLDDHIFIETSLVSYEGKICKIEQCMLRDGDICCTALFTIGLMDMQARKLVYPTPDWLAAVGSNLSA